MESEHAGDGVSEAAPADKLAPSEVLLVAGASEHFCASSAVSVLNVEAPSFIPEAERPFSQNAAFDALLASNVQLVAEIQAWELWFAQLGGAAPAGVDLSEVEDRFAILEREITLLKETDLTTASNIFEARVRRDLQAAMNGLSEACRVSVLDSAASVFARAQAHVHTALQSFRHTLGVLWPACPSLALLPALPCESPDRLSIADFIGEVASALPGADTPPRVDYAGAVGEDCFCNAPAIISETRFPENCCKDFVDGAFIGGDPVSVEELGGDAVFCNAPTIISEMRFPDGFDVAWSDLNSDEIAARRRLLLLACELVENAGKDDGLAARDMSPLLLQKKDYLY